MSAWEADPSLQHKLEILEREGPRHKAKRWLCAWLMVPVAVATVALIAGYVWYRGDILAALHVPPESRTFVEDLLAKAPYALGVIVMLLFFTLQALSNCLWRIELAKHYAASRNSVGFEKSYAQAECIHSDRTENAWAAVGRFLAGG